MSDRADPRVLLVATVKNEGPNILEWVAHHLLCGFEIQVYQNDSDDETSKHLRTLQRVGAIQYFRNHSDKPNWQHKAYRRASYSDAFTSCDWCMALDGDEFLNVHVGNHWVQDLIASCSDADEILVNWRIFGSNGETDLSDELVTHRYDHADPSQSTTHQFCGFKSLFRTDKFTRPGIHRARVPLVDAPIVVNGSGLREDQFEKRVWRSRDPGNRKLAQVNHYAVRDAASFLIKSDRGSSSHPDREVAEAYWRRFDVNIERDERLKERSPALLDKMKELDELSGGRLFALRESSLRIWQEKLQRLLARDEYAALYSDLTTLDC